MTRDLEISDRCPECGEVFADGHATDNDKCGQEDSPGYRPSCALCPAPADPNGFYPDLCPTCTEVEYGKELAP